MSSTLTDSQMSRMKNEMFAFIHEYNTEGDRAAVILTAAMVDELLYQLLAATLKPATSRDDDFLLGNNPLATFSSRISACHRLGILDDSFTRALTLVRKIRNAFAHQISSATLDSGPQSNRVQELVRPFHGSSVFDSFHGTIRDDHPGLSGEYRTVLGIICIRLRGSISQAEEIKGRERSLVDPSWFESSDEGQ